MPGNANPMYVHLSTSFVQELGYLTASMAIGMDDSNAIIEAIVAILKVFHVALKTFVKLGKNSKPRINQ